MKDSHNLKEELKQFAPHLWEMPKKEGFEVPHRYFDHLADEVFRKIEKEKESQKARTPWWADLQSLFIQLLQPRPALALATVALLFFAVWQMMPTSQNSQPLAFEEISYEEYEQYLMENISEFEESLLYELANEVPNLPDNIESEILDEILQNHNEDIDFEDLEELLL